MKPKLTSQILKKILIAVVILLSINACQEKKQKVQNIVEIDLNSINKINDISLKTGLIFNELTEKSTDSCFVEIMINQRKNHQQIDTQLKAIAKNNLIVLSDTIFKKQNILKTTSIQQLNSFLEFLKTLKVELKNINQQNTDSKLAEYYEVKMNALENTISELNKYIKAEHTSNL